ncbi:MAG: PD-(D/E)XK nuclease family protein [Thermoleophilia bacterium]|nr:PD-(D/E)XK nuclease family protein [Thermoleophilia bacterium]
MKEIVAPQYGADIVASGSGPIFAGSEQAGGLTLILGPPNAGKMGLLLRWWRERLDQQPVIVAPNLPAAQDLSSEMVMRTGAVLGADLATTLDGLVRLILRAPVKHLSEFERAVIVARILRSGGFRLFNKGVIRPYLASRLAQLLEQLAAVGHGWGEIETFLERWGKQSMHYGDFALDLSRLAKMYRGVCEQLGVRDRSGSVLEAIERVQAWDRPVGFYGFTSFTPAQRKLVEALASRVEVVLVMPHDESKMIELSPKSEISFWQKRAKHIVEVGRRDQAYSSPAIAYLERHFSGKPAVVTDEPGPAPVSVGGDLAEGVRFLLSSGRQAEAEAAAEQVAELLHRGFRPSDIAVVVRRVEEWRRLLGQVFESCHIPYQVDQSVSLGQTAIGQAFFAAARAVAEQDAEALLSFMRSPYSGLSPELVDLVEVKYRKAGARGFAALVAQAKQQGISDLERVLSLLSVAGQEDAPSFDWQAAARLATHMFEVATAEGVQAEGEAREEPAALRALLGAIEGMLFLSSLDAHGLVPITPDDAITFLREVPVGVASPGLRREAVWVLSAERARARRFAAVLVLGLVEGEFPRTRTSLSLLSKGQQREMENLGWPAFAPEETREDALFALTISRAWQVLVLSARDTDDGGDPCEISRFWIEAKNLLGVRDDQVVRRTLADQVFVPGRAPSLRHFLRALVAEAGLEKLQAAQEHPKISRLLPKIGSDCIAQSSLLLRAEQRPCLRSPVVLRRLAKKRDFSPSELETYLQCPFRWFGQQVMGLEEMEEQEFDERGVGEALHAVLSRVYRVLADRGMLPLTMEALPKANQLVEIALGEIAEQEAWSWSLPSHRLGMARVRVLARLQLNLEARLSREFRVEATEYSLGAGRGVEIDGIRVRGRVDRIDVSPDGALFLVDYKSGTVPKASALGTKDGLQLPLYLAALAVEKHAIPLAGGAYVSPREGKFVGVVRRNWEGTLVDPAMGLRVLDDEEWEALLQNARDVSREAVDGIRAGCISPPSDRDCPSWCALGVVCRARKEVPR